VLSKTMWFTLLCTVEIGEALGLYHTIIWIKDLQLANVDFIVDSKKVDFGVETLPNLVLLRMYPFA